MTFISNIECEACEKVGNKWRWSDDDREYYHIIEIDVWSYYLNYPRLYKFIKIKRMVEHYDPQIIAYK